LRGFTRSQAAGRFLRATATTNRTEIAMVAKTTKPLAANPSTSWRVSMALIVPFRCVRGSMRCGGQAMVSKSSSSWFAAVLFGPALPAWSEDFPEGNGKEMVATRCTGCHTFASRVGAGYTAKGWHTVMRMMLNHGVEIPTDQLGTMTDYLIKNFP